MAVFPLIQRDNFRIKNILHSFAGSVDENNLLSDFKELKSETNIHFSLMENLVLPAIGDVNKNRLMSTFLRKYNQVKLLFLEMDSHNLKSPEWHTLFKNLENQLEVLFTEEENLFLESEPLFTLYKLNELNNLIKEVREQHKPPVAGLDQKPSRQRSL